MFNEQPKRITEKHKLWVELIELIASQDGRDYISKDGLFKATLNDHFDLDVDVVCYRHMIKIGYTRWFTYEQASTKDIKYWLKTAKGGNHE